MQQTINTKSKLHIIVRSVGERTEKLCLQRLYRDFGEECISLVKNVTPFSNAVKKAFEIGVQEEKDWTLVVDADVLFYQDRIVKFIEQADYIFVNNMNEKIFCIQPYVYDNFFRSARLAGVHLYRTEYIKSAISYCDMSEGVSLRPETFVKRRMSEKGYYTYTIPYIVGIHDYMQSYESIVKKGILHVKKHSNVSQLKEMWEKNVNEIDDYEWILKGVKIGEDIASIEMRVDNQYMQKLVEGGELIFPTQPEPSEDEVEAILEKLKYEVIYTCIHGKEVIVSRQKQLKDALLRYGFFAWIKKLIK